MTSNSQENNISVNRSRLKLGLIFAMSFLPMFLAYYMYMNQEFIPESRNNKGVLLSAPLDFNQLAVKDLAEFAPRTEGTWTLVSTLDGQCEKQCEQNLYLMRQVNKALHKEAHRVKRLLLINDPAVLKEESESFTTLLKEHPLLSLAEYDSVQYQGWLNTAGINNPQQKPQILVVDPLGNMMLFYQAENTGKDMLTDLKRMLKVSKLG